MMHMPLNATVTCLDGKAGKSVQFVVNPILQQVTYLVVEESHGVRLRRLVPTARIETTTADSIALDCSRDELAQMELFEVSHFVQDTLDYGPEDAYVLEPFVLPAQYEVVEERIPPGQLAIRRGTAVQASDGKVGHVKEFLVDPNDGHITHIVLNERHLLHKRELTVPITAVDHVGEDVVYLNLTKDQVASLPVVPVQRRGQEDA